MADSIPFDPHVPADLFAAVVEALEAAEGEFDALTDPEFDVADSMVPERWQKMADEHVAMSAVMKRIAYGSTEKRERLKAMFVEEMAKYNGEPLGGVGRIPVSDEIRRQVADALELVRRRGLVDGHVRDALDPIRG